MNIVNTLTLRHLKENKSRTVVTTLGICVSVAMITAVFVAAASLLNLLGDLTLFADGRYEAKINSVSYEQYEKLKSDVRISNVGTSAEGVSFLLDERQSDRNGTGDILKGNAMFFDQCVTCKYDGVLPQKENEIAVEKQLIEKNKLDWKVGDTVEIPTGIRTLKENGGECIVAGMYCSGEEFKTQETKEYKITAILNSNNPTCYSGILCFMSEAEKKAAPFTATIELSKLNYQSLDVTKEILSDYGFEDYYINSDYLETFLAADEDGFLMSAVIPAASIVLVLIIIASVALIYNAFAMSLSERVRYLGMLASVGATKKQKRKSIYYEGFILGAIGIPVGILAGIVGIGITLRVVGNKIISTGMIMGISDSDIRMKTVVSLPVILLIVLFSIITIFISSFIPAKKASKITPIDAIRQNSEIKVKAKNLKAPKIVRKIFGYEGELAYKNIKRNGKKSRVIIASIALSVILFFSCNYFCQIFMQANSYQQEIPYQVEVSADYAQKDLLKREISQLKDVKDVYPTNYSLYIYGTGDKNLDHSLAAENNCTTAYKKLFTEPTYFYINYIEDDVFNEICKKNSIDFNKCYEKGVLKGLLLNNISHKQNSAKVFSENMLGQKIDYNYDDYHYSVELTDFIDYDKNNFVFSLNPKNNVSVYVPESMYDKDFKESGLYNFGVVTDKHESVTEEIEKLIDQYSLGNTMVMDIEENFRTIETLIFVMEVFIYGFIALISMITVANIINTISTGIMLRRKEFAMLKSVGTTPKGFNKIVMLESAFYAMKALVFAIPLSLLFEFLINKMIGEAQIPFVINIPLYLAVIAVVFVIIGFTMLYSVRKLKDDSIVETLKKEIN
ncbi:MAG: ABC transporter permease [Acutalibacteraceae bacterium]